MKRILEKKYSNMKDGTMESCLIDALMQITTQGNKKFIE